MKLLTRPLLVILILLLATQIQAQVDTTASWRIVHGTLVEATSKQVRVEVTGLNGFSAAETFGIGAETVVDGCELAKVETGTQLLIYLADGNSTAPTAAYIKFYGCEPNWNISATILSISSGELTLQTRDNAVGTVGDTLRVTFDNATVFMSCTGMPRTENDFSAGTAVAVYAVGQKGKFRATSILSQDDCGESVFVNGTFVSYSDSTFVVAVEGKDEALRLIVSEMFGRIPADSALPIYTCYGEPVPAADLRVGDQLNVMYLSIPRQGEYLQYGQLQRDCPITIYGKIVAIDGRRVTINDGGDDYSARVDDETKLADCQGQIVDVSQLVVGMRIEAIVTAPQSESRYLSIQIKDECPYAFSIGGKISAVSQTAVTINGLSSEDRTEGSRELSFDAASVVLDCLNLPLGIDRLQVGSDVVAYYRSSGSQRIADMVIVQAPCDVSSFAGTVLSATASVITVSDADGSARSLAVDASSKLNDCNGESIAISASLVGTTVTGAVLNSTTPPSIQWATFFLGCPVIVNEGGIIAEVGDSSLTLQRSSGRVELQRSSYTVVYDSYTMPTDWSTLRMGDSVCTWYDDASKLLYRIMAGSTCASSEADGAKQMIGMVTSSSSGELTIENAAGEMSFALTNNTSMLTSNNAPVSASEISSGMRVSVMSDSYNRRGQPVASSVTVMMSPTSVDEESASPAVVVSPNPASDNVTFGNTLPGEMVTLFDQRGNRVLRTDAQTVNVSTLAPGIYSVVRENGAASRLVIVR